MYKDKKGKTGKIYFDYFLVLISNIKIYFNKRKKTEHKRRNIHSLIESINNFFLHYLYNTKLKFKTNWKNNTNRKKK